MIAMPSDFEQVIGRGVAAIEKIAVHFDEEPVDKIEFEKSLVASLMGVSQGFAIRLRDALDMTDQFKKMTELRAMQKTAESMVESYKKKLEELHAAGNPTGPQTKN